MKPWCNYAAHRTVSMRRATGYRSSKPKHNWSKKLWRRDGDSWAKGRW